MRQLPKVLGSRVEVYRNLHHDCLSVRSLGLVLGHANYVQLKDVRFVVRPTGRQRVLESKQKNVHAFAKGTLIQASNEVAEWFGCLEDSTDTFGNESLESLESYSKVSYNPYRAPRFYRVSNGSPIWVAEFVIVTVKGVYIIEEVTNAIV